MAVGLIILFVFIGVVLFTSIGVGFYFGLKNLGNPSGGNFPGTPCSQSTSDLPDFSTLPCCSTSQGTNSNLKYSTSLNMVLAPFPSSYLDVCVGFCDKTPLGPNNTCVGTTGSVAQFNQCVGLLAPKMCEGEAMPLGVDGATLYYGYLATQSTCQQCCDCGPGELCTPTVCTV